MVTGLTAMPAAPAWGEAEATRRVAVPDAGISVRYPRSWTKLPLTRGGLEAARRKLAKENPGAARRLADPDMLQTVADSTRLAAIDPDPTPVHRSLILVVTDLPFPSRQEFSDVERTAGSMGFGMTSSSQPTIDGMKVRRYDMVAEATTEDGTHATAHLAQVYVPNGDHTVIVQLTAPTGADGQQSIDDIVGSIRRLRHR